MEKNFQRFYQRIDQTLLKHKVIVQNDYLLWFEQGQATFDDVKNYITQFSVFSNLFTVAQLLKVINSNSLESMHLAKEILVNELGVIFKPRNLKRAQDGVLGLDFDEALDKDLVSVDGTVEGSTFRFSAAHFEWLLRIAGDLGLSFNELGKRRHGLSTTLHFCDELNRLYGHEDYHVSQAASFSIEQWAFQSAFWTQSILGLKRFQEKSKRRFSLGFFTYHERLEEQHAMHTKDELEAYYISTDHFDEDAYIKHGLEMLDACEVFWQGLNQQRK